MATKQLVDQEFGPIGLRRSRLSRVVRLRIDARGKVSISMPSRAPLFFAKQLIESSRSEIRQKLQTLTAGRAVLKPGDLIGKTHRLVVTSGQLYASRLAGTTLEITLPIGATVESPESQQYIRQSALKALRTQAKAYLSRRLKQLADTYGFGFVRLRFTNAGTRWGSCSSSGTISLNIWLMQLPFELIDYVIVHELCHTKQMNHSPDFWTLVANIVPDYKEKRRALKAQQPYD